MNNEFDVVVIGTYFFDEIYVGLPHFPEPGRETYCEDLIVTPGATYITAAALAELGVKSAWISCFGNDYYSQYIFEQAQKAGLDLSLARHLDRPYRQVSTSLPYAGERAFITVSDPKPDDMIDYIVATLSERTFKHLHFAWLPNAAYLPVFDLARRKQATISTDCQDVAIVQTPLAARHMIEQIDVFLPNARELCALTGTESVQAGIQQIAQWVKLLIVKDGANGAWIAQNEAVEHVPALSVTDVVDTTGAGDCFNAGFLLGYVTEQSPARRSAIYGNICAGHSVQGVGGTAHLIDRETLHRVMKANYPAADAQ